MADVPSTEVATTGGIARPAFIGQSTAVEQARAVAEVQSAIVVAQQVPRDPVAARNGMLESCRIPALAERAFFRYSRGGSAITGATVHLARELARLWGNVQYGLIELRRDDEAGFSEMQAWAWDVQTNTRNASTFVVPHKRDTSSGQKRLMDLRDVYENNANLGARRVREAIFAILPPWFTEEAKATCAQTLQDGGGKPLAQQVQDLVKAFADLGVRQGQLETKQGRKAGQWTEIDVASLRVVGASLKRGEVTLDEEFPDSGATADEVRALRPAKKAAATRKRASTAPAGSDTPPDPHDGNDPWAGTSDAADGQQ